MLRGIHTEILSLIPLKKVRRTVWQELRQLLIFKVLVLIQSITRREKNSCGSLFAWPSL